MKLKEHFKDYNFEKSSDITGMPVDKMKLVAETFVNNRPGTILYALGMTQKSVGTQGIRMYAIIQMLLGNMGMPGGGINANRGEPNVQGTDRKSTRMKSNNGSNSYVVFCLTNT